MDFLDEKLELLMMRLDALARRAASHDARETSAKLPPQSWQEVRQRIIQLERDAQSRL